MRLRYTLVIVCCIFSSLSGCKTANPLPVDFYSNGPEHVMPPLSIFGAKPSEELEAACAAARCLQGALLASEIYAEFRRSKMFESLAAGESKSDYELKIAARRIDPGDAKEFAKLMVSAASLFVLPVIMNHEYRGEFTVTWRGVPLADYKFDVPYEEAAFLLKDPQQSFHFAAESLASKFLAKAQADGIFTTDFLYAKLDAENYRKDLKAENQVGKYARTNFFLYPDPLLGAQLRYVRNKQSKEWVDIFIYPIHQVGWSDQEKTLTSEMQSTLKDIDIAVKAGGYKLADFAPFESVQVGGSRTPGKMARGIVASDANEQFRSYIYLFIMKDKIVKIRAAHPLEAEITEAETTAFVDEFLAGLDVPDESLFSATLRQNKRNSTIQ